MNNRLGTFTTIDCPTDRLDEAYQWLENEFEKIDGYVWKKQNSHDFGMYPSFEINYPSELEDIFEPDCCCGGCDECLEAIKKDDWHEKANKIEEKYSKKFAKYL